MAIEKMKLLKLSGAIEQLDTVLNAVCESGAVQPAPAGQFISSSMGFVPFGEENPYTQSLSELSEIARISGLELKISGEDAGSARDEIDGEYIKTYSEKVRALFSERGDLEAQKTACEQGIEKFSHFAGLGIHLDEIERCEFIKVRFGHMPKASAESLDTVFADNPYLIFFPCSEDETDYWGAYFTPVDMAEEIDGLFAFMLFERFRIPGAAGTISQIIEQLKKSIEILSEQIEKLDARIHDFCHGEEQNAQRIYSRLMYKNTLFELRQYAVHNGNFFMFSGWIPQKEVGAFEESAKRFKDISVEITDPDESKQADAPVKLKRAPKLLRFLIEPYKFYVDMYGTPSYGDVDITAFVAISYTLLFGIMFGDVGQGFVLSIVGFLMWKLKNMGLGKILIPCGISSMFFGFLFGSVFGYEEMLDPVYAALGWSGKPLSVMESVNTVLLVAIAIGVGMMVLAMLINMYACIKRKHYGEAIFGQNGLTGLLMYLAGANFASGFMNGPAPLPNSVCGIIIGVAAVILIFKEFPISLIDRKKKYKPDSLLDFLLQNLFELLEYVLSYLSNTVSFLRVGAFVLVHAGMMMVVFSLAGESQNLFVIILGNVLVIALEGLLTGIQALRLEYYEMFSRFYDGSGKPFVPVTLKRMYNQ